MKLPPFSSFAVGLLVFILCGGLSYLAASNLTDYYKASSSFNELGNREGHKLNRAAQSLYELELSRLLTRGNPVSLERNIHCLRHMRSGAPSMVSAPIDLQIAIDYAALAYLEQQSGNAAAATVHRQSAATILQSLGWQDTSQHALDDLAIRHLSLETRP